MIDLTQLWLLIVIFTLFAFGMFFIVAGLKVEESNGDSGKEAERAEDDTRNQEYLG